ncbi:hypothetical protein ACTXPD_16485 [Vreelandella alkaliphila]|uniref:hypothetical protein n=1 Tax=Vreelandella alkaliphila TaxID=272774 RepID=UPI003FD8C566
MPKKTDTPFWVNNKTTKELWEAYIRMMDGKPTRVKSTDRLTLSSVAKEAGFQRSTLSRKRYPDLADLIEQSFIQKPGKSMHALYKDKQKANRRLREKLEIAKAENGVLLNQLAAIESRYLEAMMELTQLRAKIGNENIISFKNNSADY